MIPIGGLEAGWYQRYCEEVLLARDSPSVAWKFGVDAPCGRARVNHDPGDEDRK